MSCLWGSSEEILQCPCNLLATPTTAAYSFASIDSLQKILEMSKNLPQPSADTKQHVAVVGVARDFEGHHKVVAI